MKSKTERLSIGVRDLRAKLAATINSVIVGREPVYVTHHGRPVAVLMPIDTDRLDVEL